VRRNGTSGLPLAVGMNLRWVEVCDGPRAELSGCNFKRRLHVKNGSAPAARKPRLGTRGLAPFGRIRPIHNIWPVSFKFADCSRSKELETRAGKDRFQHQPIR
jgi:hypothetical protein